MPSFKIIGLLVLEILFFFSSIYSHGSHFGHVTWTIYIIFGSPFLRMFDMKFVLIGQVLSEEKIFEIVDEDSRQSMAIL